MSSRHAKCDGLQVTTHSQQKKHPLFVFTSAPPATGQLLSPLITQPRASLGLTRLYRSMLLLLCNRCKPLHSCHIKILMNFVNQTLCVELKNKATLQFILTPWRLNFSSNKFCF